MKAKAKKIKVRRHLSARTRNHGFPPSSGIGKVQPNYDYGCKGRNCACCLFGHTGGGFSRMRIYCTPCGLVTSPFRVCDEFVKAF